METGLIKLRCGECGNYKHELYKRQNGEIIAECIECESQTQIIMTKPEIILRNNAGGGTLCSFED